MAPEQLELALKPAIERAEPTVRMNVYGCGALLYYLCTGGPPLPGQSMQELLVAQAAHKVPPPSRINPQVIPALDAIILKALAPDPRARFANAAELANALISIRFERSASGVRHRAVSEERTPRDRRVTREADVSSDDATHMLDAGLEERPTSQTNKLPPLPPSRERGSEPSASPFDRPTALLRATLPPETPLPPLTPLPPSVPPTLPSTMPPPGMPEEEITAETPLPTRAELERESAPERPAVLARPARRSIAPVQDLLSHFYPGAFIALAALISISIIYAVVSQPSEEETAITVTPLPAPQRAPRLRTAPAPVVPPGPLAGATTAEAEPPETETETLKKTSEVAARESRSRRPVRVVEEPRERLPPSPDESEREHLVVRPQPEQAPAPEPEPPQPAATEEPQAPPPPPSVAKSAPVVEQPAATARPPIAPLPEAPRTKPIAPLSDKATPRFYEVQVKGSLATSQVRRGIERIQSATQACFRTALAGKPSALGVLNLEIVIDERGRTRSARVGGEAPGSLQRCLESAALRITVPPPDTGTVTATWKVSL
jgi:hypothetical protein